MGQELTVKRENLPDTVHDLVKFLQFGQEQLNVYREQLKSADKLDLFETKGHRDQVLENGQNMGAALLYAEVKIGSLLDIQTSRGGSLNYKSGPQKSLPDGITHKQSHYFQEMSKYPEVVEQVIAKAIEEESIPVRQTVLNEIKKRKDLDAEREVLIDKRKILPYDENIFYVGSTFDGQFDEDVLCIDPIHGENDIRQYKDYYPTITRLSTLYHPDGSEFSIREYAKIQNFPDDFKFYGPINEIKSQIGEAVSPKMGEYIINKHIKGDTYLEIFAGCGGFSVGAHKLGKKCKWANDFNKYSGYSHKLNFPETEFLIKNIKSINEKELHKRIGDVDFIIGGPPCQGFSAAGPRLGFKEDPRNSLYLEYVRFVKEFQPKQFIMENVKEILEFKDEIIKDFEGYDVKTELVDGLDIGMEQKRVRVFFIGNLKEDR